MQSKQENEAMQLIEDIITGKFIIEGKIWEEKEEIRERKAW